jgi:GMP synthase-like glutamine amidotransferase
VEPARPAVVLRHSPNGHAGRFGEWADERRIPFVVHHSWESPPDLDPRGYAFIVVLGSAHSVHDTEPDWIATELAFLDRAVQAGTPVLGLCWGGEALAVVLGGEVTPGPVAEKGWLPIASSDPEIPAGPWAHYHSEMFSIPDGAVELGRTQAGPSAFRHGPHLGLQFHPEATPEVLAGWAADDPTQTDEGRRAISAEGERWGAPARAQAFALFDAWRARARVSERSGA